MAQGLDPIKIYQGAGQALVTAFGSVNAGQLTASTPCSEWNVKNLLNHNLNVQKFLHSTLIAGSVEPSSMNDVNGDLSTEGAEAALKSITDQVISAAHGMDLT